MKTGEAIKELSLFLSEAKSPHILSGGVVAAIHRNEPRASGVVEFSLLDRQKVLSWISMKQLIVKGLNFPRGGIESAAPIEVAPVISTQVDDTMQVGFDFVFNNPFFHDAYKRCPQVELELEGMKILAFDAEFYFLYRLHLLGVDGKQRYLEQDDLFQMAERENFLQWPFIISEIERQKIKLPKDLNFLPTSPRRLLKGLKLE